MITALFVVAMCAILTGAGWTVTTLAGRVRPLPRPELLMAAFCNGAIVLYLLVFVIGSWRLDRGSMVAVMAIATVLAVPAWVRVRPRTLLAQTVGFLHAQPLAAFFWMLSVVSVVALLVQGGAPPNDYDSLSYHLSLPRFDVESGRISVSWMHQGFTFFPQLSEHLFRLALVLAGESAAQPMTGLFGLPLAGGAAILVRRLGGGHVFAALAALMTVSVRATVWELATCGVEVQLTVYTTMAMLAYLHWRNHNGVGPALVFGAALAGATLVKYLGLGVAACFFPLVMADSVRRRHHPGPMVAAAGLALVLGIPHFLRNVAFTGNPLFPLAHSLFDLTAPEFFSRDTTTYGRSRELFDYLRVYWDISVLPTHYFDGMMLGAPYLLALVPLVLLCGRAVSLMALPLVFVTLGYTALWHWGMTPQVRFLLPVTPFLAALGALGLQGFWAISQAWVRVMMLAMLALLAANQAMFVGIYALLRLPPALGMVSAKAYHEKTPTMGGAFFSACRFVEANLPADRMVLSLLAPHSYYCPQARAILTPTFPDETRFWLTGKSLPALTAMELAERMRVHGVALVVIGVRRESRSGPGSLAVTEETDYSGDRIGRVLAGVLPRLTPLHADSTARVYDGIEVIAALSHQQDENR